VVLTQPSFPVVIEVCIVESSQLDSIVGVVDHPEIAITKGVRIKIVVEKGERGVKWTR
jgi:hypothetical protein